MGRTPGNPSGSAANGTFELGRSSQSANVLFVAVGRIWLDTASLFVGCTLLFTMVSIPTAYTTITGVILILCLGLVIARWVGGKRAAIDSAVGVLAAAYVVIGVGFTALGLLNHNSGALAEARVFVVWPIIYLVLISAIDNAAAFRWIDYTLLGASLAISIYSLDFLAVGLRWLPGFAFVDLQQDARVVFYSGFLQFNLNSLASMLFLTPWLVARAVDMGPNEKPLIKLLTVAALVLSLCITLLALRRALLLLVVLATPILIIGLGRLLPGVAGQAYRRRTLTVFGLLGAVSVVALGIATFSGHLKPLNLVNEVISAFDFSGRSPDASIRGRELVSLVQGWLQSPTVGHGLGAVASFVRSPSQPWAYELSYNDLLFQTGVIGGMLYLAGVVWIFWQALGVIRSSPLAASLRPVVVGSICFLLANGTNPYLAKFDYLWTVFLPLAYVNFWRLKTTGKSIAVELDDGQVQIMGIGVDAMRSVTQAPRTDR